MAQDPGLLERIRKRRQLIGRIQERRTALRTPGPTDDPVIPTRRSVESADATAVASRPRTQIRSLEQLGIMAGGGRNTPRVEGPQDRDPTEHFVRDDTGPRSGRGSSEPRTASMGEAGNPIDFRRQTEDFDERERRRASFEDYGPVARSAMRILAGASEAPFAGAPIRAAERALPDALLLEDQADIDPGHGVARGAGLLLGAGAEIAATKGAARAAAPMVGGRAGRALQLIGSTDEAPLVQRMARGAAEGVPTDVGFAMRDNDLGVGESVALGSGIGAIAEAVLPGGRAAARTVRDLGDVGRQAAESGMSLDDLVAAVRPLRMDEAQTRQVFDAYDEASGRGVGETRPETTHPRETSQADPGNTASREATQGNETQPPTRGAGEPAGDLPEGGPPRAEEIGPGGPISVGENRTPGVDLRPIRDRIRMARRRLGTRLGDAARGARQTYRDVAATISGVNPRGEDPELVASQAIRDARDADRAARADSPEIEEQLESLRRDAGVSRQRTLFPGDDSKVDTEYAVVEADELVASHTPDFAQRPPEEFPPEIQGRAYHGTRGRQTREHTEGIVSGFDVDRALDMTVSAAEGPPVVTDRNIAVAGNGRIIAQQRLYRTGRGDELRAELRRRAAEYGADPEVVAGMQHPVLVRRIVDDGVDTSDVDTLRRLNASSDVPTGKTKDVLSDAASRADQLRSADRALGHFAETAGDETIRSYLGTGPGREFLRRLVEDGVITKSERARFIDATTGAATDEGKTLVERMFYAAAIGDADVVARAPEGVLRKMDTALPAIIRADRVEGWELGPTVREALDLLASARAQDMALDDLVAQVDIARPAPPSPVVQMARFLERAPKNSRGEQLGIKDAFRAYADDAEAFARQTESEDLFGFEPRDAGSSRGRFAALQDPRGESFRRLFGQEIPSSRRRGSDTGGAVRADSRSEPPGSQRREVGAQRSTRAVPQSSTTRTIAPPRADGGDRIFSASIVDSSGFNVVQPVSDLNELFRRAEATLPRYRRALRQVAAEEPGVSFDGARVKGIERAAEKVAQRTGNPAVDIPDILGGRLTVDTIEDGQRAIERLEAMGWRVPPWGTHADEAFFDAPKGGYRARHVQLASPSRSLIVELQLRPPEIARVQGGAHRLYEVMRGSVAAPADEVRAAILESERIFSEAWGRYLERTGHRPSPARQLPPARSDFHPLVDLFGEETRTPRQGSLELGGRGPQGITAALEDARATVSSLEGKVSRGAASAAEEARFEEARSLIRRSEGRGLDLGEVSARRDPAAPAAPADNRDLFDPLVSRTQRSEFLPSAGEFSRGQSGASVQSPVETVRQLTDALDRAIEGGLKFAERGVPGDRAALGGADSRRQLVRSTDMADAPIAAHELGHIMQKLLLGADERGRIGNDPLAKLSGSIRGELEDLGRGISDEGLTEGWAEAWRRYLDNPEALEREAPHLARFIDERLEDHPALREAWNVAREEWRAYRESSPQARVGSKISVGDRSAEVLPLEDRWTRFRTAVLDDFEPIRKVVQHIRERAGIESIDEDAEQLARLSRGSAGAALEFLEEGAFDFSTLSKIGPGLKEILEPVTNDLDGFRRYIVAKRAIELHERDIRTGFRDSDVRAVVSELEERFGDTYRGAFGKLRIWNTQLLRYLMDSGVISRDTFDAILEANQSYVPFYRVREGKGVGGGMSQRFGHLFNPTKRIRGSGRDVIDPLESLAKNAFLYTHIAQAQQVSTALARLAEKEGVGAILEELGTPIRRQEFRLGEITRQLEELVPGVKGLLDELPGSPAEELLAVFRPGDYFGKPNMISVLEEGKRRWYEVDPQLYSALQGLERESLNAAARWLGAPARTLRAGATLAPEFLIRNPIRDQVMAFIQSEYGYTPFVDMARGAFELARQGEAYHQWRRAGGYRAALASLDRRAMQRSVRELTKSGGVANVLRNPMDVVRAMSALMEDATRMGEFLNARAVEGTSKEGLQRSAAAAREISIDFARHGAKTTMLRHLAAFWNARLQGYDRLARSARKDPVKFGIRAFSAITLPSLLEYYLHMDDLEYWEQPQWKRDLFWMVRVGDDFVSIPKPFELGLMFGTLPVRVLDSWVGGQGGNKELRTFFEDTLVREAEGMVPFPTATMPLIENATNYSFFLRRPITPRSESEVRDREQGGPGTSEVARMLARWSPGEEGISPRSIDNLLFSYTGGLGRLGTELADEVIRDPDAPAEPSRRISEQPGVRGIMDPPAGFSSESVERFYREYERARVAASTLRFLERTNNQDRYQAELGNTDAARLRQLEPAYRRTADELAKLRAAAEAARRDPSMDADAKRERIEELGRQAIEVARGVLGRSENR